MSTAKRFVLFIAKGLLLLACTTGVAYAQQRDPNQPRPTPTPTPLHAPKGVIRARQGNVRLSDLPGIYGSIRWKKKLGLPYDSSQVRAPYPVCSIFRVRVTVQEPGSPGTFGVTRSVADLNSEGNPAEERGYYVCRYGIADQGQLPYNRTLKIWAELDPRILKGTENQAWSVGSETQPPPGYERTVIGGRGVTLTDGAPRVTADFEMVYRPISAPR